MAVLEGNTKKCREQIEKVLKKINEGEYEIDYTTLQVGTEETEPTYDKDGQGYSTYKRNFRDTLTVNYIDIKARIIFGLNNCKDFNIKEKNGK